LLHGKTPEPDKRIKKNLIEEEKQLLGHNNNLELSVMNLSEIEIKNPVAILSSDSKTSKKLRKPTKRSNN
jgi:hypothetical protein